MPKIVWENVTLAPGVCEKVPAMERLTHNWAESIEASKHAAFPLLFGGEAAAGIGEVSLQSS